MTVHFVEFLSRATGRGGGDRREGGGRAEASFSYAATERSTNGLQGWKKEEERGEES